MIAALIIFFIVYVFSILAILYIDYIWLKQDGNNVKLTDVLKFAHPYTYIPVINTVLFITIFLK